MNATPQAVLTRRLHAAMVACGLPPERGEVTPAADTRVGDYQANAAMVLAKQVKANPRELAAKIAEYFETGDVCEKPEIAGPGFLNFRLRAPWIALRHRRRLAPHLRPRRRRALRRAGDRTPATRHHRLQLAQHRQTDARRTHPEHDPG